MNLSRHFGPTNVGMTDTSLWPAMPPKPTALIRSETHSGFDTGEPLIILLWMHDLTWIKDAQCQVKVTKIRTDGTFADIKQGSIYNDFYGPLTCMDAAIKEALELCEEWEGFTVTATLSVHDIPVWWPASGNHEQKDLWGRMKWLQCPSAWLYDTPENRAYLLKIPREWDWRATTGPRKSEIRHHVVWSNELSPNANHVAKVKVTDLEGPKT